MISEVANIIRKNERFLITSHVNPDGDAIGCLAGCGRLLELLQKDFIIYAPSGVPELFSFLEMPPATRKQLDAESVFDASLIFDTADPELLGSDFPEKTRAGIRIVIDHHLRFKNFGDLIWRDPEAAAAGVMLYRLAKEFGIKDDARLGEAIWCALYTDTGGFRYSSTNPEALYTAGEVLSWGVDPWKMAISIYESNPAGRVRLLAKVLSSLEISPNGKVAVIIAPKKFLVEENMDQSMLDTFINHARGIKGVEIAIQLSERENGWKAGLRSKGNIDVSELAAKYGGGGHKNAAGCLMHGDLENIKETLMRESEQLTHEKAEAH